MKSMPRAALAVPVVLLVALLASCGVGGSTSKSDSGSGGATSGGDSGLVAPGAAADSGTDSGTGGGTAKAATTEQAAAPLNRAVISTGQISLHSKSIAKARAEVVHLVDTWNGSVADEQSDSDEHGRMVDSTMTLRVPTSTFDQAMNALARVGKVEQQTRTSKDVTTKVLDNDARVRAGERSIRQIEVLMGRAQKLSDIIAIESDLARRQADLDSLRSQQAWLEDQTSLSTITVHVARPATVTPPTDASGFLAGLDDGWDAFKAATVGLLTVLGAVLPFAVLVGLVGVPLWLVVRRRLGARLSAGSAPARSA